MDIYELSDQQTQFRKDLIAKFTQAGWTETENNVNFENGDEWEFELEMVLQNKKDVELTVKLFLEASVFYLSIYRKFGEAVDLIIPFMENYDQIVPIIIAQQNNIDEKDFTVLWDALKVKGVEVEIDPGE